MSQAKIHSGDCLSILPTIPDGSIDMILTDLPYGTLNKSSEGGKWDSQIPLQPLWEQFLRVSKQNAAIVLFAQGMFTARLMMSQPRYWKYNLIWRKNNPSGFLNANRMPMREHEDICVFYRQQPTFNPQMKPCSKDKVVHSRGKLNRPVTNNCYGTRVEMKSKVRCEKCPTSVLDFPKPHHKGQHPTEKPVDLCRWLIRTYTNPDETVLDATMGSGTTGVAAIMEGRDFIGIERDEKYLEMAILRIGCSLSTPKQENLFNA